ncbi:MAG: trypsin-like peptidase domain-containing protein [Sedimentisphaerales bacterium]|nr:trypsin-like peptidase domain-containing protein [Sedimentisphaerales bacterium]
MALETERDGYPLKNWWDIAETLARQTFQVRRKNCRGTAFLVSQGLEKDSSFRHYCFATAWHVINDILDDDHFILFRSHDKLEIGGDTYRIMTARLGPPSFDLGFLFLRTVDNLLCPKDMMPVRGLKTFPSLGENLGWYGYPGSLEHEPMFCRGTLACFKTNPHCYLINGLAYPGMSGGAVVDQYGWVVGVISEWWQDGSLPQIPGMLQAAPSAMIRHVLEDRMKASVIDSRSQRSSES